jgi:hypothetical protein
MPIAPQHRRHYGNIWRRKTRPAILERAQNACECCGKPNGRTVWVLSSGRWYDEAWKRWRAGGSDLVDGRPPGDRGVFAMGPDMSQTQGNQPGIRLIRVVLTVAHINQVPGDDRAENLAALCQYCHLWHDRMQHARNARLTRSSQKDRRRPLLAPILAANEVQHSENPSGNRSL